jgi:hypothetical protein
LHARAEAASEELQSGCAPGSPFLNVSADVIGLCQMSNDAFRTEMR